MSLAHAVTQASVLPAWPRRCTGAVQSRPYCCIAAPSSAVGRGSPAPQSSPRELWQHRGDRPWLSRVRGLCCQGCPTSKPQRTVGDGDEQAAQGVCWHGAARTILPVPLFCAREFPARILGSIKGCKRSSFLSQTYLASAAGFATSSHGNQASVLSSSHFCFSISQGTPALQFPHHQGLHITPVASSCIPSGFLGFIFHSWREQIPLPPLVTLPLLHTWVTPALSSTAFGTLRERPAVTSFPCSMSPAHPLSAHCPSWMPAMLSTLPGPGALGEQAGFLARGG